MLKEDSAAAARILVCDWLNLLAGPMIGPGRKYFFNIVVSLLRENRQGRSRVDVDMFLLVYNPPEKITRPQAGVLDFRRGGLKGNDQKKYTMEVKTVKARKSDGLV